MKFINLEYYTPSPQDVWLFSHQPEKVSDIGKEFFRQWMDSGISFEIPLENPTSFAQFGRQTYPNLAIKPNQIWIAQDYLTSEVNSEYVFLRANKYLPAYEPLCLCITSTPFQVLDELIVEVTPLTSYITHLHPYWTYAEIAGLPKQLQYIRFLLSCKKFHISCKQLLTCIHFVESSHLFELTTNLIRQLKDLKDKKSVKLDWDLFCLINQDVTNPKRLYPETQDRILAYLRGGSEYDCKAWRNIDQEIAYLKQGYEAFIA